MYYYSYAAVAVLNARLFLSHVFVASTDYEGISEEHLVLQPDEIRLCTRLNITRDDVVEGEETLTVHLSSTEVVIGEFSSTLVTIIDSNRKWHTCI